MVSTTAAVMLAITVVANAIGSTRPTILALTVYSAASVVMAGPFFRLCAVALHRERLERLTSNVLIPGAAGVALVLDPAAVRTLDQTAALLVCYAPGVALLLSAAAYLLVPQKWRPWRRILPLIPLTVLGVLAAWFVVGELRSPDSLALDPTLLNAIFALWILRLGRRQWSRMLEELEDVTGTASTMTPG